MVTSIWNIITGCYKLLMFDYLRKYVFYIDLDPFNYLWPFDWDMWFDVAKTISWGLWGDVSPNGGTNNFDLFSAGLVKIIHAIQLFLKFISQLWINH